MTPLTLEVGDLGRLAAHYAAHLDLVVLQADEDEVVLGRGTAPVLVLRPARPDGVAPRASNTTRPGS